MTDEATDWARFRVDRISLATFVKRNVIHAELLAAVLRRARGSVLEVGVGSGAQSAILSRVVPRTVTVDNDGRILSAARPNLERFGPSARLVAADAFALPFPDASLGVAVSQGLLEHFGDLAIGSLLREQLRVCRTVVFSVPSDHYPRQDVGDERLLSPVQWQRIVEEAVAGAGYTVSARYYRFDLEALKYSAIAREYLGRFSVLVTVDPL
ncbi:MAG: class I SAM-dependent methyltransferase [Gemmatimonadota bacterium]